VVVYPLIIKFGGSRKDRPYTCRDTSFLIIHSHYSNLSPHIFFNFIFFKHL